MSSKAEQVLIYDISTCPSSIDMETVANIYENRKIVIWDSSREPDITGVEPKVLNMDEYVKLIDVSYEEIPQDIQDEINK